jgi:hypothetical protein
MLTIQSLSEYPPGMGLSIRAGAKPLLTLRVEIVPNPNFVGFAAEVEGFT